MRLLSALLAVGLVAAACSSDDDDSAGTDDGRSADAATVIGAGTWQLTAATVDGNTVGLLDTHPVTLTVADGEVSGTAACNGYSGTIATDGDMVFEGFAVTEMACDPPAAMELESTYLTALGQVDAATVDGDTLVLTGATVELSFSEEAPMDDAELVGTTWLLESLVAGDDSVSSVLAGLEIDLLLEDSGEITGTDGCNRFNGTYELDGDVLTVGPLAQTRRACDEATTTQANQILAVLGQPMTVALDGDQLELSVESGDGLVYRAA
ncbi:MAG: META domain-containing protein [Acidimicrobiia bacterium]|nr:META domain-containing protein [Acidimicrobiia bacterium]